MPAVVAVVAVVAASSAGTAMIGAAVTFGLASGIAASVVGGIIIGAVAGGITAAVMGQDVLQGALAGGLAGGMAGYGLGATAAAEEQAVIAGLQETAGVTAGVDTTAADIVLGNVSGEEAMMFTGKEVQAIGADMSKVSAEGNKLMMSMGEQRIGDAGLSMADQGMGTNIVESQVASDAVVKGAVVKGAEEGAKEGLLASLGMTTSDAVTLGGTVIGGVGDMVSMSARTDGLIEAADKRGKTLGDVDLTNIPTGQANERWLAENNARMNPAKTIVSSSPIMPNSQPEVAKQTLTNTRDTKPIMPTRSGLLTA